VICYLAVNVFLNGCLGMRFSINILLTIFGYLLGIGHSVWIISAQTKERQLGTDSSFRKARIRHPTTRAWISSLVC